MITSGLRAQDQLFIPGPAFLLDEHDRYRLFARVVMPRFCGPARTWPKPIVQRMACR